MKNLKRQIINHQKLVNIISTGQIISLKTREDDQIYLDGTVADCNEKYIILQNIKHRINNDYAIGIGSISEVVTDSHYYFVI